MEFITNTLEFINWWAVLLAVVATLPIGFLWYDLKLGFGKAWMHLVGLKASDLNSSEGMAKTFLPMLFMTFLSAVVLVCLQLALGISGTVDSLLFGAVIGLVLRASAHVIHNGFAKRRMLLTLIDAGHDTVSVAIMSLILGVIR